MKNILSTIIETERLILRPVSLEYKELIFPEFTDNVTTFMFPSAPKKIEETEEFILDSLKKMKNNKDLVVSIFKKDSNEFLGGGGIHNIDTKTPELGIWIKESTHGHKYGREAVAGLKTWADNNLEYDYLSYPVAKENIASQKKEKSDIAQKEAPFQKPSKTCLHKLPLPCYPPPYGHKTTD